MENKEPMRKGLAWGVHLFTASGICVLFLALIAAVEMNIVKSFLYLCTATVIDAVDGTLSRVANVKTSGKKIDGGLLDNIIDIRPDGKGLPPGSGSVEDGEMLIIGGLIDSVEGKTGSFAPIVGSIPVIKYLFGVEEKRMEKRELVILLAPKII